MRYSLQISYRDENSGGGAFYDHYRLQHITNYPTEITKHPNQGIEWFQSYVKIETLGLKYGHKTEEGKTLPAITQNQRDQMGLLVIPGRARDTESKRSAIYALRSAHEKALLKEAQLIGRPVLAICAGAWTLWESFGGRLMDCEDHCYRGGMPRLVKLGRVGYNVQIHDVAVCEKTMLSGIVKNHQQFSVNSVHWKIVDATYSPGNLMISATAEQNDEIAPRSPHHDGILEPDEDATEAFETKHGVPMMGIQWHPEAYNDDPTQHAIIQYMALAGLAFMQKRRVISEINEYSARLNEASFFAPSKIKTEKKVLQSEQRISALLLSQ